MEVQLSELIEKIKNDGVKSAEENAARIISEAEEKAAAIVKQANEEANSVREVAKADAEKAERSGIEAIRQAGRDLVLTVKAEIETIFGKVIKLQVADSMDSKLLAAAVSAAVNNLSAEGSKGIEVQIPETDFAAVESELQKALAANLASGIEIVPFKGLDAGFRISMKDGSAFFDFSDKEIAEMLSRYLNPRLGKLLSE